MSIMLATSMKPPMPTVELMKKRATVVPARPNSPWNRSFARMTGDFRLRRKLRTPSSAGSGSAK